MQKVIEIMDVIANTYIKQWFAAGIYRQISNLRLNLSVGLGQEHKSKHILCTYCFFVNIILFALSVFSYVCYCVQNEV